MTPTQRAAAERLAKELASVHPLHPYVQMCGSAAALLRELLEATDAENATVAPQQRKPLKTAMEAEIECDCLVAWNASTYGHSAHDTVHPMFLSAFIRGYRAAERAHGITGEPT